MGNGASIGSSTADLATVFDDHNMNDVAQLVRDKNMSPADLKPFLQSPSSLCMLFEAYGLNISEQRAEVIIKLSLTPQELRKRKEEEEAAVKIQAIARGRVARTKPEGKINEKGPANVSPASLSLQELEQEMNSVATYSDSQQVLCRWCRNVLEADVSNFDIVRTYITKNSVLMPYMNDIVSIDLARDFITDGKEELGKEFLALVADDTKIATEFERHVEAAAESNNKDVARALAKAIPDSTVRLRLLGSLDTENTLPLVQAALDAGEFSKAVKLAEKGHLARHKLDEMLEKAVCRAVADGNSKDVSALLKCFPESRVASVAIRAIGACNSADMFKLVLGHALAKTDSDDEKVGIQRRLVS